MSTNDTDARDGTGGFKAPQHMVPPALWPRAPKPAPIASEWPKFLRHPQHAAAVSAEHHEELVDPSHLFGGRIGATGNTRIAGAMAGRDHPERD
jgi:hypothetical protein